jgi:hypothetical protein
MKQVMYRFQSNNQWTTGNRNMNFSLNVILTEFVLK